MRKQSILLSALLALDSAIAGFVLPTKLRGKYKQIGTTVHLLTDTSRVDPYDPKHGHRNVLVHVFYPTTAAHNASSPYGYPTLLRGLEKEYNVTSGVLNLVNVNAETNAPWDPSASDLPLVLFSPGMGIPTNVYASMTAGLVSHGYVVATIDHAYDSGILEYPDGTIITAANITTLEEIGELTKVRVADAKFVLDSVTRKGKQGDFIPGCAPKVHSACSCYDVKNVGSYGHSLGGGGTTGNLMLSDSRVKAGINIDGMFLNTAAAKKQPKLPGPFLIMQSSVHNRTNEDTYQNFWDAQRKRVWLREISYAGFLHISFSDLPIIVDGLGFRSLFPPEYLLETIGTINGLREEEIVDAYVSDFFNMALKGQKPAVVAGPNKKFPEATFEN